MANASPRLLWPLERGPGTHCRGGWLGPRAGVDGFGENKYLYPHRAWNPRSSSSWRVAARVTLSRPRYVGSICLSYQAVFQVPCFEVHGVSSKGYNVWHWVSVGARDGKCENFFSEISVGCIVICKVKRARAHTHTHSIISYIYMGMKLN